MPGMSLRSTFKRRPKNPTTLVELRRHLLLMAGRVEAMIAAASRALVENDIELAEKTIADDRQVNRDEIEIDRIGLALLSDGLEDPRELRFVTLALKMVVDLERIGDLAVNICERALDLSAAPKLKPWIDVPRMAELVQTMVRDAIDAFVDGDAEKARQVVTRDDEVDALYTAVFREVLDLMLEDKHTVERGIHVQSVAKWLERMADHSTNLAEQVIFLVEGEDPRHPHSAGLDVE
jgi:phosphate transport system protein